MPNCPPVYDAQRLNREIEDEIWPFVSRSVLTLATLPSASLNPYKLAIVSDGTSNRNLVQADGSGTWRYMDGVAV